MKRFGLTLLLLLAVVSAYAGSAPDSRKKALAIAYMEAAGIPSALERSLQAMLAAQKRSMPEFERYRPVLEKYFRRIYGYDALRDDLAVIHLDLYSEAELRELTAFYRTPIGRRKAAADGKISVRVATLMEKRAERLMVGLRRELEEAGKKK